MYVIKQAVVFCNSAFIIDIKLYPNSLNYHEGNTESMSFV